MSAPSEAETAMAAALLDPARPGLPDARFAVHRNNVAAGLVDALAGTCPAVRALVGEAFFGAAALRFVRAHPPRSPVLILWGAEFADWLAAFPPAASVPYLPDVARLEWARVEAYHAADAAPAGPDLLAGLAPDVLAEARLALHPSLRLVPSRFPAASLWADVTRRAPAEVDMTRAETALVVRPHAEVIVEAIPASTRLFLTSLMSGASLASAAEAAAGAEGFGLGAEIAFLFRRGLVAGLA